MGIWVDTDFGFDDLWALLILRGSNVVVDGISLVSGNSPIDRVIKNALGAEQTFKFGWLYYKGAKQPLCRAPETAERILGSRGMQSRGQFLPEVPAIDLAPASEALLKWLGTAQAEHVVLALGPLTNLATLALHHPESFNRINRIVWMGGSSGPGNHSKHAEFNAIVDAEAVASIIHTGIQLDVVDLQICRQVTVGEKDIPAQLTPLIADLLGGYLDIALQRGRTTMAIYDPLAALALADSQSILFEPQRMSVETRNIDTYGMTRFNSDSTSNIRLAVHADPLCAVRCLNLLKEVSAGVN